jgi:hypothetical protein
VSGTFQPNTTSSSCALIGASTCDIVLYNFDQAVTGGLGANTLFHVYGAGGGTNTPPVVPVTGVVTNGEANPAVVQLSTAQPNVVAGYFPAGFLATGPDIGISVETGAAASPNASQGWNAEDEIGVANGSTTAQKPGFTIGPDLINVTQSPVKDAFGTILTYAETYTFDQPLGTATTAFVAADVHMNAGHADGFLTFDSDNTQLVCSATAAAIAGSWSSANPASVTCAQWNVGTAVGPAATLNQQTTAVLGAVIGATGALPLPAASNPGAIGGFTLHDYLGNDNSFGSAGITGTTGTPQFG